MYLKPKYKVVIVFVLCIAKPIVDVHYLQETTPMIHTPLTLTKEAGAGDYQVHNSQYQLTNTEFKLPTRKEKEGILLRYARKLGLNDRGCYLAIGLALLAFLLLCVIIIMAACWPGKYKHKHSDANKCFLVQNDLFD